MSIYREYDIRGIYEKELNELSTTRIGYALASKISGDYVAVGYDARSHSPILFEYLVRGLNAGGKKVLDMGLVPTPVNYFTNYQEWDGITPSASVMITGSHNPSEYNGFKITLDKAPFFGEEIYQLGRECEAMDTIPHAKRDVTKIDAVHRYIDFIVHAFQHLKGMPTRIVYDCGNGVAGVVTEDIFSQLELTTKGLYVDPDGTFPNHHPDPSDEHNLEDIKKLLATDGDIAFAYDGDADRIAVLTHKNNIKGDMMALLYSMKMDKPTVIGEVKCSQVMYDELEKRGATAIMYKTGHSNLKVKMRETNADLACEVSGHVFFKNRYFGYDDAIYATLRMLELVYDGIDLDAELAKLPQVFSTQEIKVETTEAEKFKIIDKVKELLKNPHANFPTIKNIIDVDGVRINFENGWGLVRASNTTPVLVTRFESTSKEEALLYEKAINDLILEAKNAL
ncbi:MAG: phosphomannomutase/phosphoglucomutase [Epsilonproteobacteria bacterium]|nr:phosphomannomutase/phosphoglucomutase [Campylobacterota bacterium]OIO15688.1 MAG: phospho-sugar mutase [Helicobacteraceae bacterium CG1_02_36_14]PIP10386.1 MAG: phospho-sugar mutase [Sulfurimonas sp. CG23_combo_of_CG06-09_8_20_14_all_36_33]PIS24959.1 MAG: phosphomannomutase/phosphoglucomutase [Sulfurimonas sp. CG08_land_8_20_14_0_20_36_33]PIU34128.1 MAG: phosphomannomutase/phosphoglucomutase [Sulfurimonas sp. CG07_land_8_20_14_0_80_36_56]PIV04962.1 MAG: phosphomannomutase/phosphoglucomutase